MRRSSRHSPRSHVLAAAIVACLFSIAPANAEPAAPVFKRGATLVEFFQFPVTTGEGAARSYADPAYPHWQSALSLFDFDALRRIGFDHLRVPLDVGPLMQGTEQERQAIIAHLLDVVEEINRHGLSVVVPLFPPSLHHELPQTYLDGLDGPKFQAYLAQVERVAVALQTVDTGIVALEAMNEPQSECRVHFGTDWTEYQEFIVANIRRVAPDLPLFLTGGCWSNIEGIVRLDTDLLHDPRNFVSVHFYYPFLFTHQSATWSMPYLAGTIGVPYPAAAGSLGETLALTRARFRAVTLPDGADRAAAEAQAEGEIQKYFREAQGPAQVDEWMNMVAQWRSRVGIASDHIVFTEFGAMKQIINGGEIDRASRARWLHDASSAIERRGWGWTAFVLRDDPFGLYVHMSDRYPDPKLLAALGLNVIGDAPDVDRHAGP
jgi:endoglucanase